MYAGPGSEYYPRIEILDTINSVISVSDSTYVKLNIFGDLRVLT